MARKTTHYTFDDATERDTFGVAEGVTVDDLAVLGDGTMWTWDGAVWNATAAAPGLHATTHENGGSDEISVLNLSGLLADPQTPTTHAATHQNGGGDEINVAGLSGVLADPQTPATHAATHQNGGGDEINVAGLSGLLADDQNPVQHSIDGADHSFPGGATVYLDGTGNFSTPPGVAAPGIDTTAYHDNVANEIKLTPAITDPTAADLMVIEDSTDAFNKKSVRKDDWQANRMFIAGTGLVDELLSLANTVGNLPQPSGLRAVDGSLQYSLLNGSGVALVVGDVMQVDAGTAGSCEKATPDTSTYCGIVVEAAGAGAGVLVWLANVGDAVIKCDAGAIAIGDHLDSAGAGLAHTHQFATGNTFAVATTSKGAGAGTVRGVLVAKGGNGDVRSQLPSISVAGQLARYPGVDAHDLGVSSLFSFGACLSIDLENKSGGAIPLGTVLMIDDTNDNAVVVATNAAGDPDKFAGIAMAVSAADTDPTYCGLIGVATVNCDATAVVRGDYMEIGPTAGLAVGLASGASGTFGIALTGKGVGLGQVEVLLRGMEIF